VIHSTQKSPCLDRISETLDSLHRRRSAFVHLLVDALEVEGKGDTDADDEELASDRSPETGTEKADRKGRVSASPVQEYGEKEDLHVPRGICLPVDSRSDDTTDTTHTNDNGRGNCLLGVGNGVVGLVSQDGRHVT
jgi:hypothetical protein